VRQVLNYPSVYQQFQVAGGFFGARVKAIADYLKITDGQKVIDIGCGPGYIREHLPDNLTYIGFDIDPSYIEHAQKMFGPRGTFLCKYFDADAARHYGGADIVMMNGVMHHIGNEDLVGTLANVRDALKPGGTLFTLDGCYRPGQSRFAKWMLDNDRGRFVRDEQGYRDVLRTAFEQVDLTIREDYARVPYTFVVGVSRKGAAAA
jgi:SAM-dependent methyltransferase